ncbi:MAG: histidinol dehydrogenase [Gammaproteobacteria bacterium]
MDPAVRRAALLRPAIARNPELDAKVRRIIAEVRQDGDAALLRLARDLDRAPLAELRVSDHEAQSAEAALPAEAHAAIATAIANVRRFHEAQTTPPLRIETAPGVVCERISKPLDAVGLYVPAGSAPLPSTAIMLGVPSAIAGCPTRVMCTPPRPDGLADPAVVVVARACGIRDIFKAGGAQAIAAMAYGTASVPKVAKIFGPGNAWVTAAKSIVASDPAGAALDMPAGPSEVMVVADRLADPRFVAMDLLSQAEHGPDSHVVLVTLDAELLAKVEREIENSLASLSRRSIIEQSLRHAVAVLVSSREEATAAANEYAPEHLIVQVADPRAFAENVSTAGSVFLGRWTPESVGDYCSGTNHVLPTYGYARAYSGLSVTDFQRRMTVQEVSLTGLRGLAPTVRTLAGLEGLDAHARAVTVRLDAADTRP